MGRHADLLTDLRWLTLRAEAACSSSARLIDENDHLRRLAAAQLRQMSEITRDFSASGRIHYPAGSVRPRSCTLASR